jgi:hypothetical protein
MFCVHILTTDQPFLDPQMFRDRNFRTGLLFIFVIGIILLASLALCRRCCRASLAIRSSPPALSWRRAAWER